MVAEKSKILTAEQEAQLLAPIDEHVGAIQEKINALRVDGTDKVLDIQNSLENLKRDRIYTAEEKQKRAAELKKQLAAAKEVEAKNKAEVSKLIAEAESYLKANYGAYYQAVVASCAEENVKAQENYKEAVEQLHKEHQETVSKLSDQQELKDERYVHKNRLFDAKMNLLKEKQEIKDRRHAAFDHKYHLIDLLRMSKFTYGEKTAQSWENYRYTFNRRDFFLRNGLYIAIVIIFIALCIVTPIVKGVPLLTLNNVLNILSQASPRMFLALGVAGLILLAGTDLSIGRMVGMGMTAATIIMHNGPNTGSVFGKVFDFTGMPLLGRVFFALIVCIVLCTIFTTIAGFFTAKFKMHPFISTMANMLVIFGLVTYSTKGVSFGGIDSTIPSMIIPKLGKFPTIILWAAAAVIVVWFIWNKTTFGKNMFALGSNEEAARVSGVNVLMTTVLVFALAGAMYGWTGFVEGARVGSNTANTGLNYELDGIAACVIGGVSFVGGIGKIRGIVIGVLLLRLIFVGLNMASVNQDLIYLVKGGIILFACALDMRKYLVKK